jgi:superfamily I DNA/RNA helicase
MSGGFVFIIGMNDGDLPRNPQLPTDHEVCQFIVALTRTRKRCYVISNGRFGIKYGIRPSSFLRWISGEDITHVTVDAQYFRKIGNQV